MIESIINLDIAFFLYLNNLGTETWDFFWMTITNMYTAIPLYLFFIWYSHNKYKFKFFLTIVLAVIILITLTDQGTNLFKNVFVKRLRPCYNEDIIGFMRLVKPHCGGKHGFFSAHASNNFALVVFFGLMLKKHLAKKVYWFYIWACLVAYSRIYIGVHYPLDVLTGALYGSLLGGSVFNLWKKICT